MYRKVIVRDRITKDFAMYLNGELIGYAPSYFQAETRLNKLVYDLLSKPGTVAPKAAAPADDIAADDACVA